MVLCMSKWRVAHVGVEGDDFGIGGHKLWREEWRSTGEKAVSLPHPSHPHQRHQFDICEIGSADCPIRFAVGELSNGVWGFYIPD